MGDRELLELAAKAAGIEVVRSVQGSPGWLEIALFALVLPNSPNLKLARPRLDQRLTLGPLAAVGPDPGRRPFRQALRRDAGLQGLRGCARRHQRHRRRVDLRGRTRRHG